MRLTSRPSLRRGAAAATLSVLALGGLAACGDDSSGGDSATDTTNAAAAISDDLDEGDEVDPAEFVRIVTDGLEASTTAHITMDMSLGSAGEMTAEGDVDYTTDPAQVAMTMANPMGGGDMDVRMVDGIFYLSMGDLTQGKFIKLDPSEPDGPLAGMGLDKMLDQMDPSQALKGMEDGLSTVVYAGEEDGLDHYELTVDIQKAVEQMGGALPEAALADLPEELTYDLWLDDEGRFTRMTMDELPMGQMSGSMELAVSGWGEDVDIEAPAADQITEMPDLGSMMQGMNAA